MTSPGATSSSAASSSGGTRSSRRRRPATLPAVDRVHERAGRRASRNSARARSCTATSGSGNCIVDDRGEILAVLDWEICTLGDPRADVGYVLATWAEPGDPLRADDHNPTLAPGFTTRDALLERYAERSGRDVQAIPYFVAFSFWRLACILEGVLSRIISGARGDTDVDVDYFRRRVEQLRPARRGIRFGSLTDERRESAVPTKAPAVTIAGYSHVAYPVDDLDAAVTFYCDVLGFTQLPMPDFGPQFKGAWLRLGSAQVHLGTVEEMGTRVGLPHIALHVPADAWD